MFPPETIASKAEHLDGRANIAEINRLFRLQDDSHLWPIRNRFNATERAIRRARIIAASNGPMYGLEYALTLDLILSEIVNSSY